jgi:hypothetical protein
MDPAVAEYVRANDEARARLRVLLTRLRPEQLTRVAFDDWTVSALLAHLAFWDRFTVERWRARLAGREIPDVGVFTDPINDAGAAIWKAVPGDIAVAEALAAADAADTLVAGLAAEFTKPWRIEPRPRSLFRSEHRREHLQDIERAIS